MSLYSTIVPLLTRELYDPIDQLFGVPSISLYGNQSPVHYHLGIRPRRQTSTDGSRSAVELQSDPNKFQVVLNVKHFKPEELNVKIVDNNFVVIHGKHEETADEHGFISREFTRRYAVPDDVQLEQLKSSLSRDGILTIQAPKKVLQPAPENERIIPITLQRPAVAEQQQQQRAQEDQQQPVQQQQQAGDCQDQDKMDE